MAAHILLHVLQLTKDNLLTGPQTNHYFFVLIMLCSNTKGDLDQPFRVYLQFNIIFNVTLIEHFTSLTSQVLPCLTLVEVEAKLFSRILPKVLLKIFIMEKICYQFLPLSLYMVGCFLRYKVTRIYLQVLATKLFLQAARKCFFAGKFTCWVTIFL